MRRRSSVALVLAACFGPLRPARIDPARFVPQAAWTPQAYVLGAGPPSDPAASISRDDGIEDVAFLDHALVEAWPEADSALGALVRDRARDAPLTARTAGALCEELARQMHGMALAFAIGGKPCLSSREGAPPEPLAEIPDGRNYVYRIDHVIGEHGAPDTDVPVLAIARFVDLADPGWDGFTDVLADLATREAVVLDLQRARGSDPRMGFAILAVLGRTRTDNLGWVAPLTNDSPYAQVARANFAERGPAPSPRSRALWESFGAPRDVAALSPVAVAARTERLVQLEVLVGPECEAACGVVANLAKLASGSSPSIDLIGRVRRGARGDELGVVRLPKSGVEVTFPTAVYGPSLAGETLGNVPEAGFAAATLRSFHATAAMRAQARAWSGGPLPACSELPADLDALRSKLRGCAPPELFVDKQASPATITVMGTIALDAAHTQTFLASCPGIQASSLIYDQLRGNTLVSIYGAREAVARVASASFARSLEWECPMELEGTAAR